MTKEDQLEKFKELFCRFKNGRFDVESILGIGGMGVVVRARDTSLQVARAIKIFNPELNNDSGLLSRFKKEAAIMSMIDHPNIVRVYDIDEIEQHHFMILEWIDGGSLGGYLKEHGAMQPFVALQMMYRVCDALSVAHKQNVVHRDIKPDNILISTEGVPKVTDFGIAHMDDPEKQRLTLTNQGAGSPGYMAPEQMSELASTDARADIYAVAVTFWSLITALRPPSVLFFHDIEDSPELLQDVPVCLHEILKKAVARRPEHRYTSIDEFVLALRAVEHQLSSFNGKLTSVMIDQEANITDPTMLGVTKFSKKTPMYANDASLPTSTQGYRPSGEVASSSILEPVQVIVETQTPIVRSYKPLMIGSIVLCIVGLTAVFIASSRTVDHVHNQPDATARSDVPSEFVPPLLSKERAGERSPVSDVSIAQDVSSIDIGTHFEPDVPIEVAQAVIEPVVEKPSEKQEHKVSKLPRPIEVKAGETLVLKPKSEKPKSLPIVNPSQLKPEMVKVQVGFEPSSGDSVRVWLVGPGGKHKLPGSVQPGIYKVVAIFQDQDEEHTVIKNLEIKEGSSIRLACWSATEKCSKL